MDGGGRARRGALFKSKGQGKCHGGASSSRIKLNRGPGFEIWVSLAQRVGWTMHGDPFQQDVWDGCEVSGGRNKPCRSPHSGDGDGGGSLPTTVTAGGSSAVPVETGACSVHVES